MCVCVCVCVCVCLCVCVCGCVGVCVGGGLGRCGRVRGLVGAVSKVENSAHKRASPSEAYPAGKLQ